jgi:uncharacterized membrane protein
VAQAMFEDISCIFLGNKTNMTSDEREKLKAWIEEE